MATNGPDAAAQPAGTRPAALIADDEEAIALLVADALEEEGFETTVVPDGAAALKRLEERSYDLLVTDVRMPRLDGADLVRALRALGNPIPVIVLSGYMNPDQDRALQHLGISADAIFEKPTSLLDVSRAARLAFERARRPAGGAGG
ncbi:response regulator [Roseomonas sp. CCTCC AB2023176]|uniref:response regulator n=1 Tax=Roseomonas sp. CCTCC AB2023176 TaxID=3342640 RepID=UPI0035DBB36A